MPYQTINRPSPTVPATTTGGCGCGCSSCDTCDSLQCLCRPRFFAGQLVTDADFRRLDQYLVGKDRLHNKFLHGTGVVCGLEVVCNPCDDTVTVRPGYALGPCGEDIVVCADYSVDVGAMIRAERRACARAACPPGSNPYSSTPADCDALEQRWILGICYDEQPGSPVTSLTTTACSSSCNCGCGGSSGTSSGGCGCNSGCTTTPTKPIPVGCEPTVICEGFRFTLTKERPVLRSAKGVSAYQPVGAASSGALADQVRQCLAMLAANITQVPNDPSTAEIVAYCCELKADLRNIIGSSNIHDCTMGQRLNEIVCPDPNDREGAAKARQAISEMLTLAIDLYRECVCSALLPPCPNDCIDDCVPIATLTVRSSDLHVLEVCNWDSRKFAVTMPMFGYWLGWLPLGSALRKLVSTLCCGTNQKRELRLTNKLNVREPAAERAAGAEQASAASTAFTAPLRMAMRYSEQSSSLAGFEATFLQSIGATGEKGAELATDEELADPFAAAALSRLLGSSGLNLGAELRDMVRPAETAAETEQTDRLTELEKSVEALQRTVRAQARTISALRKGPQK